METTTENAGPVIQRGQVSVIIVTLDCARQVGFGVHPEAAVLAWLLPDEGGLHSIHAVSAERLQEYLLDLAPHSVRIQGAPGEDLAGLYQALGGCLLLEQNTSGRVH